MEIATRHNKMVFKAVERAVNQQFECVVVDTDHVVTGEFFERFFGKRSQIIDEMAMYQRYDIVFLLDKIEFTQDGSRRTYEEQEREKWQEKLIQRYKNLKIEIIRVQDDTIENRLTFVLDIVKNKL